MTRRRIAFVTGSRAEFGLMERTLVALRDHAGLELQLIVTGVHLSRAHGRSIDTIRRRGWNVDATVAWSGRPAEATGRATAGLAKVFDRLGPDMVLVVGDRVEAFAAASAAHLAGRIVAHVHGGDRAEGQVDDALRHAITKLSHVHLAATPASARRIVRLGEDRFRVHVTGTPGLDGLDDTDPPQDAPTGPYALVVLHPDDADARRQAVQARRLIGILKRGGVPAGRIVQSNNDPGWTGIADTWNASHGRPWPVAADLPRPQFLHLLQHAAFLIGNSSSGIIEAASYGTPVINIGDRQRGRERSRNVIDVDWTPARLAAAVRRVWNGGRPRRFAGRNVYGGGDAGRRIAAVLAALDMGPRTRRKLIAY